MRAKTVVALAGSALLATLLARADEKDKFQSINDGRTLYYTNCAACHGADGKGAVKDLGRRSEGEVQVPDLTTIEARDGKFDALHVSRHVAGSDKEWGQCETGMACWQRVLSGRSGSSVAYLQVYSLVNYLRSIQQNPPK